MKRFLSGAILLVLRFLLPGIAATPAQISFVQPEGHMVPIPCTNLSKIGQDGQNPRGLNTKTQFEHHNPVQTRFVQEEVTEMEKEGLLSVMFWNVENFFDWRNDSTSESDLEFSPAGERHWTWKRFQAKANTFAKALFWIEGETGRLPDIIGLEEVENAFVLRQVLQKTALRKLDYKYVHFDSPDRRGIDVALLYRSSRLELLDSKPCHLFAADTVMATRDILLCVFRRKNSDSSPVMADQSLVIPGPSHVLPGLTGNLPLDGLEMADQVGHDGSVSAFAVLVNHHPSKYGGAAESEPRRRIALERLRFLADSLAASGIDRIIAGGDFNDTPSNPVFGLLEPALMPLHIDLYRRGLGTIKYDGKWDLIDHIYISPGWTATPPAAGSPLVSDRSGWPASLPATDDLQAGVVRSAMRILRIPFLLTRDNVHSGEKPLRTYTGPRHTGGVSDHLPVLLEVFLPP